MTGAGRFAPSPSGDLHLGNLRTALLAWLFARHTGRRFLVRIEDLDRDRTIPGCAERQLADLAALGLDWDGEPVRQSGRIPAYDAALARLDELGLVYPCYCTRREIREAVSAPHSDAPEGAYPGTCRTLTTADRARLESEGRRPALRLRAEVATWTIDDTLHGSYAGPVDDLVLRRNDEAAAYNLAVVVDDAHQGIDQVVRGDDLLSSAPRQAYLAALLGLPVPSYAHVPLALNRERRRLAKRDGAVTLADLAERGTTPARVLARLAASLGLAAPGEPVTAAALLERFVPAALPREPWIVTPQR